MNRMVIILFLIGFVSCAQEWEEIVLIDYPVTKFYATSELGHEDDDHFDIDYPHNLRYGAANLFDGNLKTAWIEGAEGDGIGESVYVVMPENSSTFNIYNGYGKSQSLYERNNRVKKIRLSYYIGVHPDGGFVTEIGTAYKGRKYLEEFIIHLDDIPELQTFKFPLDRKKLESFEQKVIADFHEDYDLTLNYVQTILQFEIAEVYKGSHWDDTCISEIFFSNTYVTDTRLSLRREVKNIYVDETNEGRVMIDLPGSEPMFVLEDESAVFQVIETSPDNQWVTIIKMPADIGEGRGETEWLIFNTFLGEVMNQKIEKTSGFELFGPFFLSQFDGNTILEHSEGTILLR